MTSKKSLKRKSVLSIISIVLCISMFAGTTFAWFTDTASNTGNRIVSGTLKVDLLKYMETNADGGEYVSIKDGKGDIFYTADDANNSSDTLWEPGKTQIVYLAVQNIGKLALKYNILLDVIDPDNAAPAYSYAIFDKVVAGDETFTAVERAGNWTNLLDLATEDGTVQAGRTVAAPNGKLLPAGAEDGADIDYFALAIHMNEDAGNEYQDKEIVFDVTVVAGQYAYEEDTFGPDYDAEATLPTVNYGRATEDGQDIELHTNIEERALTVTVPGTYVSMDDLFEVVANNQITTIVDDEISITFDLEVDKNGEKLEGSENAPFTVVLYVGYDIKIDKLTHNGTEITDYVYDEDNGTITFTTATFSPFTVEYHKLLTSIDTGLTEGISLDLSSDITTYELNVTTAPADAKYKDVVYSSDDETVATVDENGVITAVANGTATITIKAADEDATKAETTVDVEVYTSVTGVDIINIVEGGVRINKGDNTFAPEVSIAPPTASNQNVTWSSDDDTIAYVDDNGKVVAAKKGTATLTVTTEDGEFTDSFTVEVWVPVDDVEIDQESTTLALNGTTSIDLSATVSAAVGEDEDVSDASVTWASSEEGVATVDENGVVTAVGVGTTTITVTTVDGGKTDEIVITVKVLVESVTTDTTIALVTNDNNTAELTATVLPENATNPDVEWSIVSGADYVSLEGTTLTAVANGTATIRVTSKDDATKYADCTVTVTTKVVGIDLDADELTLITNDNDNNTATLTATIDPNTASNQAVTWSVISEAEGTVVTVENGVVTAVGNGTVIVRATSVENEEIYADCTVTVTTNVEGITVSGNVTKLYSNDGVAGLTHTTALTATITNENASDKTVTWASSNPAVATVDDDGVVTGVASGTAVITATANDGSGVVSNGYTITVVTQANATVTTFSRNGNTNVNGFGTIALSNISVNNNGTASISTDNNCRITITPSNGRTITGVTVTYSGSGGTFSRNNNNSTTGFTLNGNTATYSGSTTGAVSISVNLSATLTNWYPTRTVSSIAITYEY